MRPPAAARTPRLYRGRFPGYILRARPGNTTPRLLSRYLVELRRRVPAFFSDVPPPPVVGIRRSTITHVRCTHTPDRSLLRFHLAERARRRDTDSPSQRRRGYLIFVVFSRCCCATALPRRLPTPSSFASSLWKLGGSIQVLNCVSESRFIKLLLYALCGILCGYFAVQRFRLK